AGDELGAGGGFAFDVEPDPAQGLVVVAVLPHRDLVQRYGRRADERGPFPGEGPPAGEPARPPHPSKCPRGPRLPFQPGPEVDGHGATLRCREAGTGPRPSGPVGGHRKATSARAEAPARPGRRPKAVVAREHARGRRLIRYTRVQRTASGAMTGGRIFGNVR